MGAATTPVKGGWSYLIRWDSTLLTRSEGGFGWFSELKLTSLLSLGLISQWIISFGGSTLRRIVIEHDCMELL